MTIYYFVSSILVFGAKPTLWPLKTPCLLSFFKVSTLFASCVFIFCSNNTYFQDIYSSIFADFQCAFIFNFKSAASALPARDFSNRSAGGVRPAIGIRQGAPTDIIIVFTRSDGWMQSAANARNRNRTHY